LHFIDYTSVGYAHYKTDSFQDELLPSSGQSHSSVIAHLRRTTSQSYTLRKNQNY